MDLKVNEISKTKIFFVTLFKDIFTTCLLSFIIFLILEGFREGLISSYFNINWLILAMVLSLILFFSFAGHKILEIKRIKLKFLAKSLLAALSFFGVIVLMWDAGKWTSLMAFVTAIAVFFIIDLLVKVESLS